MLQSKARSMAFQNGFQSCFNLLRNRRKDLPPRRHSPSFGSAGNWGVQRRAPEAAGGHCGACVATGGLDCCLPPHAAPSGTEADCRSTTARARKAKAGVIQATCAHWQSGSWSLLLSDAPQVHTRSTSTAGFSRRECQGEAEG